MSRRALTVAVTTVIAVLVPIAAHADTTVVSRTAIPDSLNLGARGIDCGGTAGDSTNAQYGFVNGPSNPPLGTGSLHLNLPTHVEADLEAALPVGSTVSDLSAFSSGAYLMPGGDYRADAVVVTAPVATVNYDVVLQNTVTGSWQNVDLTNASSVNVLTITNGTPTDDANESWSDFSTAHGDAPLAGIAIEAQNCGSDTADFYLDNVKVGVDSTTTTYDFEAPRFAFAAPKTTAAVTAGRSVHLAATLTIEGQPDAADKTQLWAKPAGATAYTRVGTTDVTTDSHGVARASVRPSRTTRYQWRLAYPGYQVTTATTTVPVRSAVSLVLAKRKIKAGKSVTASGFVTPHRAKQHITLWAKRGSHKLKLGKTTTRKNGSYSVSKKIKRRGRYRVYVVAAKDTTNLAGTSATKNLKVN